MYFFRIFVQFTINTYRNTNIIIDYLYCYYNWWQLSSENPYGYSMCCLRTYCVFFSLFYLYTESVYFILFCSMSNKILPYHTILYHVCKCYVCFCFFNYWTSSLSIKYLNKHVFANNINYEIIVK